MKNAFLALVLCLAPQLSLAVDYQLETLAEGFNFPWSITFLPDGDYLVAMRSGEVRRVTADGVAAKPLTGTPETYVAGQGGYFDIVLDPAFAGNSTVYLAYAGGTPRANGTTITRATLTDQGFANATVIFSATPTKDTPQHYGGKLLFLPDGTLMLTTGDGFEYRERAQDKFGQMGKVLRMNPDGSTPADNPFADGTGGNPLVYSYGHRNPQGLARNSITGAIYMHEHGPKGGDELNLVLPGANYGWPAVTYGENYTGAYVSPLKQAPGVEEPMHYWVPSIAPSGMVVYDGDAFPAWRGDVFIGALVNREVRHLKMAGDKVVSESSLFGELGERIRDVRVGPEGFLYLLTDGDQGKIVRVRP
ncbi:MAG: PQQ-dependent sugar dehydrogenase [Pseudomonadota bacterium]